MPLDQPPSPNSADAWINALTRQAYSRLSFVVGMAAAFLAGFAAAALAL